MTHPIARVAVPCLVVLLLLSGIGREADAVQKSKRFGIEGQLVNYDPDNKTFTIRVLSTNVQGRGVGGNTVGGKAPDDVPRAKEVVFAVEPEGSVLRRTVIKGLDGGGLDKSGTKEGFLEAVGMIPKDRSVVMSCEQNDPAAVSRGAPKYKILLVQIQLTEEELRKLWEERTVEE